MKSQTIRSTFFCLGILTVAALSQGCGKAAGAGATGLSIPSLKALVKSSLPKGLVAGNTAVVPPGSLHRRHLQDLRDDAKRKALGRLPGQRFTPANASLASGYLTNMFQEYFSGVQGYLMMEVSNIDTVLSSFNGADPTVHTCLAAPVQSVTMNLNAIDPMLSLTLPNLQCLQAGAFSSFGGGGTIFGQSGANTSLWTTIGTDFLGLAIPGTVTINTSLGVPGGGFWNYANVTNAGSTAAASPETLDAVAFNYSPLLIPNATTPTTTSANSNPMVAVTRFKAIPSATTFEMFYAATAGDITSAQSGSHVFMGAGFRVISDGVHIYADGTLCNDPHSDEWRL